MIKPRKPATYIPRRKRRLFAHPDPTWPLPAGYTWYVLLTEPRREPRVAAWLEDMGFFAFYPVETRWKLVFAQNISAMPHRKKRSRIMGVERREPYHLPVIPRLIVLGSARPVPWLTLLNDDVHRVVALGLGGKPAALRPGGAEKLQAMSVPLNGKTPRMAFPVGSMAIVSGMGNGITEIDRMPKGRWELVKKCFDLTPPPMLNASRRNVMEAA